MKYRPSIFIFLIFLAMWPAPVAFSQNRASLIRELDIDIWPDYDRPSVLVLLTGQLPENTKLPASVTLPLPESARLNAVARIDAKDGRMKDDIVSSTDPPGMVTFITPDYRFRVEYYFPYAVNNNQHAIDYTWLAPVGVNVFRIRVQQPASAQAFKIDPATATIMRGDDGFTYHIFPTQVVDAWQPVSLRVEYHMAAPQLSKKSAPSPMTAAQSADQAPKPESSFGVNLALIAMAVGGLVLFGVLIWQVASRRALSGNYHSVDPPTPKRSAVKYCSQCGQPVDDSDSFCRECGHKL